MSLKDSYLCHMTAFLELIADDLIEKHGKELRDVWIILPGKRAGLFLRKYLAQKLGQSFFAPQIFTLPDFISKLANKNTTSKLDLLLLLFQVYKEKMGEQAESFDVFSKWGSTALSDFADIEQALASGSAIFKDLRDIKEIDNWSFNSAELSESQLNYLEFWNQLGAIYTRFREEQKNQEKYSYALLCNDIAQKEPASLIPADVKNIWIAGLSNLSKAEQRIVQKLKDSNKAQIKWDADDYYLMNDMHEAGSFLRRWTTKEDRIQNNDWRDIAKTINNYETTTPYSQALLVSQLISGITPEQADKTAIILADATLLIPIVRNIPQLDCKVNIALGYPLKQTAILKLMKSLLALHMAPEIKAKRGIYYKLFLQVVEQQSLAKYLGNEIQSIRSAIARDKRIYIRPQDMDVFMQQFPRLSKLAFIFSTENRIPESWLKTMLRLTDELLAIEEENEFEIECILRAQELLAEVVSILANGEEFNEMKSLHTVIQQLLGNESITFTGEPLEGLQILNMVETRAIDFEHVIIVGANEDQLPGNLSDQSLIPFDVRTIYDLPIMADREATYAYTLYRLLQRASRIDFLYSSITADFRGTEKSRYITQLEIELRYHSDIHSFNYIKSSLPATEISDQLSVPNDDYARERIKKLWAEGISPSALNKYLTCPLDFYYRYILGLGEEEEVEELISSATFGSAVHDVLEHFFSRHIQSFPTLQDLKVFKAELSDRLKEAFKKHYGIGDLDYGENYLQFSLALKMLEKAVEFEIKQIDERKRTGAVCTISAIESKLTATVEHNQQLIDFPLTLKGKADRIDEEDDIIRIIDYKTGSVSENDVKLKSGKSTFSDNFTSHNTKVVQLLFYIYMKSKEGIAPERIRAALFSLKNHSSGWQLLLNGEDEFITAKEISAFEDEMVRIAKEMIELNAFTHQSDSKHCEYCMR